MEYKSVKPIESRYNQYGFKGVKRNADCKKQYVAVRGQKLLGRFHTPYEAGQAYAWAIHGGESLQQEFGFDSPGNAEESRAGIKNEFVLLLKNNEHTPFSTLELIDEIFDLKPSERRRMLKANGRLHYQNTAYSRSILDVLFKNWTSQQTEIKGYKNRGINYYIWQESKEERALKLIHEEYGELNSTPSSLEEISGYVKVHYANGDFGFKVSLEANKVVGFKVGLKSFNWEA